MTRTQSRLLATCCVLVLFAHPAAAGEKADAQRAKDFWKTLGKPDLDGLKDFYAPKVTLKAGSELLKREWGLSMDRSQDLQVPRDDLLQAYQRMIDKIGRERWNKVMQRIGDDSLHVSTAAAKSRPFPGVLAGDTVLKVAAGDGDDAFYFVFRRDAAGKLLVHLEQTDY